MQHLKNSHPNSFNFSVLSSINNDGKNMCSSNTKLLQTVGPHKLLIKNSLEKFEVHSDLSLWGLVKKNDVI